MMTGTAAPTGLMAALARLVEQVVGERPARFVAVSGGEVNKVYRVALPSSRRIIVRVGSLGARFVGERWALDRCRAVGIGVPAVLAVDRVPGTDRVACIQDELGHDDLLSMSRGPDRARCGALFAEAGRLVATIHTLAVDGFGWVDDRGCGGRSTWREIMLELSHPSVRPSLRAAGRAFGVPVAVVDAAAEALAAHEHVYDGADSRLLHGDVTPRHIRVLGDGRLGIIDMEDASGGDPVHDLAWWSYWPAHRPWSGAFLAGYGDVLAGDRPLHLLLARLRIGLALLQHYAPGSHPNGWRIVRPNLLDDIEALR